MRGAADRGRVWVGLWLALALLPCAAVAQIEEFVEHTCDTPVSAPDDLALHLSIKGGQRVFREGEIIPLQETFTSTSPERYWVAVQGLNLGGRSQMETFCIDPPKGTDPLADYDLPMMSSADSNGMPLSQSLGSAPFEAPLELNEWLRLPPGNYRLHIVSPRVTRADKEGEPPLILRSDEVRFTVVKAQPEWQGQQLVRAERMLDSHGATEEQNGHAARVLRFLGSEQATRELARRFQTRNQPNGSEYMLGLLGSPDHAKAIAAMRAEMENPKHPITEDYLSTLAHLELASEGKRIPPGNLDTDESARAALGEYQAAYDRQMDEGWTTAATLAGRKTGAARALTISALLESTSPVAQQSNAELRRLLVPVWTELPVKKLNELLQYKWDEIGGREWLPVLQRIATSPASDAQYDDELDRGSALLHLYELSPQQGRELILKEIAEAHGDIGIEVLGRLPDKELPQFDGSLAQRLQSNGAQKVDASLLDRYASGAILNQVQAVFESEIRQKKFCGQESAFLRYFLRVDPEYGVEQLKYVIEHPESTCGTFRFADLGQYLRLPKVEQMAIDQLEQPSPSLAADPADALSRYGSTDAEAALWKRLEELHTKWKDRPASEFHPHPAVVSSELDANLESALVQALTNGQAWCMDEKKLKRLHELASSETVDNSEVISAERALTKGEFETQMFWWQFEQPGWRVGWYKGAGMAALKEKLAQLPPGTRLKLTVPHTIQDHTPELSEFRKAAAEHNLVVEDVPKE